MEKAELRRAVKEKAETLTAAYRGEASEAIASRLILFPWFEQVETIFIYVSMQGEPETRGIIETALAMGKRVLVPRCKAQGIMEAVEIQSLEELCPGRYGIAEPKQELPAADAAEIRLAVVPCVSADRLGGRLGHGAGYYDRYLAALPAYKLALCFEALLSDEIPMEADDVRMDRVVTEACVYHCRKEQQAKQEQRTSGLRILQSFAGRMRRAR